VRGTSRAIVNADQFNVRRTMKTVNPSPPSVEEIIGKKVLIGITQFNDKKEIVGESQFSGNVTSMDEVIHVRLDGSGKDYTLPPDLNSFLRAKPGIYRLRSTGATVENPDFTASWSVHAPKAKARKRK
jgi:hypothetical protein